jgi:hypothetical protein
MSLRMSAGFVLLLVLGPGLAGCGGAAPTAPSYVPPRTVLPPPEMRLLVFTDALTGLTTSDVRDLRGHIVRFNGAVSGLKGITELVWTGDNTIFPRFPVEYGYDGEAFAVLFGSENGERRAYLTFNPDYWHYPPPANRVDLDVLDGKLIIRHPDPPVFLPGS